MSRSISRRAVAAAVVALALIAVAPAASALDINGFLRDKGVCDLSVSYTAESYDHFWMGPTKVSAPPGLGRVDTQTLSLWVAYGVTDNLTLFGTLPYVDTEGNGTAGMAESDLQDATALFAYRLGSRGTSIRSEFIASIGMRTPASNYEADLPVSVGDGTTDGLVYFVYQLQWKALYFSQEVGFEMRGGDAPNGFPLFTELGYTFGRVTVTGFFKKYLADGGTDIGDPGFTFPSNKEEYERAGARVFIRLHERFGISVMGFGTLSGRNTGDTTGGSIGFNTRF